jgi:hypothetical protein
MPVMSRLVMLVMLDEFRHFQYFSPRTIWDTGSEQMPNRKKKSK